MRLRQVRARGTEKMQRHTSYQMHGMQSMRLSLSYVCIQQCGLHMETVCISIALFNLTSNWCTQLHTHSHTMLAELSCSWQDTLGTTLGSVSCSRTLRHTTGVSRSQAMNPRLGGGATSWVTAAICVILSLYCKWYFVILSYIVCILLEFHSISTVTSRRYCDCGLHHLSRNSSFSTV